MASHTTGIIDTDSRFVIDIVTGKIENHSDKESLRQYSHNSERFSFEMPRHVEGHDMTNCNKVTVNYLAADIPGEYEVDDLAVDSEADDKITFSWLISSNVTQKKGKLRFAVVFEQKKMEPLHTDGQRILTMIMKSKRQFPMILELFTKTWISWSSGNSSCFMVAIQ